MSDKSREESKSSSGANISQPSASLINSETGTATQTASPILGVDSSDLLVGCRLDNGSNGTSSDEKSAELAEEPNTRKHNTRGRNGIKKQRVEVYYTEEIQLRNSDDDLVNKAALLLASLDQRACARALLKDAHSVLEEILLPMSFPWTHPSAPFTRIPRDIEDIPSISSIGCMNPDNKKFGKFDSSPYMNIMAARRSNDPGVVELTRLSSVSKVQVDSLTPFLPSPVSVSDISLSGELSLVIFQDIQKRKRLWSEIESRQEKTQAVSFRLSSTSSRSTILDAGDEGRLPLILAAVLPREAQDGKRKSGFRAFEEAEELGSYNCRQRRKLSPSTSTRPRAWVGRNRLIWSTQEQSHHMNNRLVYRSILTGERLESNVHKRPLLVKVGLQLNGRMLSTRKSISKKSFDSLEAGLFSADKKHQLSYTSKVINESIDRALSDSIDLGEHSQCTLNLEKFFVNISSDYESNHKEYYMEKVLKSFSFQNTIQGNYFELKIKPPRLDCIPSEDGIISVCCSTPGKFEWISSQDVHLLEKQIESYVMEKLCSELKICIVCLSKAAESSNNVCDSCSAKMQHRATNDVDVADERQICSVCGLGCGVMLKDENQKTWQHNVCRVWVGLDGDDVTTLTSHYHGVCQLCSEGSTNVVRCAADNCHVRFHPYCALISSKIAGIKHGYRKDDPLEIDAFLCTQHELSILRTSFSTPDSHPLVGKSTLLPVAFCGYHNPKRQADFFGLYPGGCYLGSGAMRIPPRRGVGRACRN